MMRKLRVGIIGTGMALEKLHYPAYQELGDKYEIVALCDEDINKAYMWAHKLGISPENVYSDFHQMLYRPDIDLVDIMVPISQNYIVTEAAAAAGKPVICEKPLAPTPQQARRHAKLPRRFGVPIMIAENYRYNEEINIIRDMIHTGYVGQPVYFIQNRVVFFPGDMYHDKFPAKEWRQRADFPGGALLDTAVHDIAALRHIFGAIERLQAFGVPQDDPFSPYAVVTTNMLFKNGITGNFSFYCAGREMQRPLIGLRIFCTGGEIYLEERDCGTVNVAHNDGRSEQIGYRPQRGFYNELLNFYNAAMGKETIAVTPEMEYGDAKTIFDILNSARTGQVVEVDRTEHYTPDHEPTRIYHLPHGHADHIHHHHGPHPQWGGNHPGSHGRHPSH